MAAKKLCRSDMYDQKKLVTGISLVQTVSPGRRRQTSRRGSPACGARHAVRCLRRPPDPRPPPPPPPRWPPAPAALAKKLSICSSVSKGSRRPPDPRPPPPPPPCWPPAPAVINEFVTHVVSTNFPESVAASSSPATCPSTRTSCVFARASRLPQLLAWRLLRWRSESRSETTCCVVTHAPGPAN